MKEEQDFLQDFFDNQRQKALSQAPQVSQGVVELLESHAKAARMKKTGAILLGTAVAAAGAGASLWYFWESVRKLFWLLASSVSGMMTGLGAVAERWSTAIDTLFISPINKVAVEITATANAFPYWRSVACFVLLGLGVAFMVFIDSKLRKSKKIQTI